MRHGVASRRAWPAAACALATWTLLGSASAQAPAASDEQKANARALGEAGVRAAMAGDCETAIAKLTAAERLFHAPTTAERLGACLVKVGKTIAGTELLNSVRREAIGPGAPAVFVAAQARAAQEYEDGVKRIGRLHIHVDHAGDAKDLAVQVDGDAIDAALLDGDRLTDPGDHVVRATATGFTPAEAHVVLKDGESQSVTLSLVVDPTSAPPIAAPSAVLIPPTPSSSGETPASAPPSRVPAFVALGAGGAGLAVGTVFGVLALATKSALDDECKTKVTCPSSSQSDIDALRTRSLVSTIGFGVGVAGVAVGGVLLLTAKGRAGGQGSTPAHGSSVAVTPWIGPASAGVTGVFQ